MVINQLALRGLFSNFNAIFNKAFEETTVNWDKIAMEVPSVSRDETYAWLGQIPSMREWIGDRVIQNLSVSSYTIVNKDFELTISLPRNDIEDDRIGVFTPLVKDLAQVTKRHPDELVFNLVAEGFKNKCYDGEMFFSDKHPLNSEKKVFQSNLGKKKLSMESYAEARTQMMCIKGENNKSLKIVPNVLVVPPQLEGIARKILFSDEISSNTNIYKGSADLIVDAGLADYPNQWYLLSTNRAIRPFIFQNRKVPKLISLTKDDDDNVFWNKEYVYGTDSRCNTGYGLWQLAYGSTGETE